jgi:hypothetical protein
MAYLLECPECGATIRSEAPAGATCPCGWSEEGEWGEILRDRFEILGADRMRLLLDLGVVEAVRDGDGWAFDWGDRSGSPGRRRPRPGPGNRP